MPIGDLVIEVFCPSVPCQLCRPCSLPGCSLVSGWAGSVCQLPGGWACFHQSTVSRPHWDVRAGWPAPEMPHHTALGAGSHTWPALRLQASGPLPGLAASVRPLEPSTIVSSQVQMGCMCQQCAPGGPVPLSSLEFLPPCQASCASWVQGHLEFGHPCCRWSS